MTEEQKKAVALLVELVREAFEAQGPIAGQEDDFRRAEALLIATAAVLDPVVAHRLGLAVAGLVNARLEATLQLEKLRRPE